MSFITALFGMNKENAIADWVCIKCHQTPEFFTEAGKREYLISAMCEKCFDELFEESENE